MSFKELFEPVQESFVIESFEDELDLTEAKDFNKASELLRNAGFKIRLETRTMFGTQIDLARDYDKKELQNILKDFDVKMKGRSLFVS